MKRFIPIIFFFAISLTTFINPPLTHAVDVCPESGQYSGLCGIRLDDSSTVIRDVITIAFVVASILALFFLIYGGIRWITSGGDKGKVDEARKTITAAVIGLIVTFLAFFILSFVQYLFGMTPGTIFTIPRLTGVKGQSLPPCRGMSESIANPGSNCDPNK